MFKRFKFSSNQEKCAKPEEDGYCNVKHDNPDVQKDYQCACLLCMRNKGKEIPGCEEMLEICVECECQTTFLLLNLLFDIYHLSLKTLSY